MLPASDRLAGAVPFPPRKPNMDVPRKDAAKKRLIKRIIIGLVIIVALVPVGYFIGVPFLFKGKLKPAAPGVELSTLWPDTVRRGFPKTLCWYRPRPTAASTKS